MVGTVLPLVTAAVLSAATAREAHVPMPPSGVCPPNTVYVCKVDFGTRYCTYREFLCDKKKHCENGEDEGYEGCERKHRGVVDLPKKAFGNTTVGDTRNRCRLKTKPDVCKCSYDTRLECPDRSLRRVPRNVSTNVTHMYLQNNRIVPQNGDLDRYKELQMINLNRNGIQEIPVNYFANNSKLFNLVLRSNRLRHLEVGVFAGASEVTRLLLDGNQLTEFQADHMRHLPQLHFANLSSNRITLEGYEFPNCSLVKLHLDNNLIRHISSRTFQNLSSLKTLHLENNLIRNIAADAFHGLRELVTLWVPLRHFSVCTILSRCFETWTMQGFDMPVCNPDICQ